MSDDYAISFTNYSSVTFARSLYGLFRFDGARTKSNPFIGLTQTPDEHLKSSSGYQRIAVSTNSVSFLVNGGYKDILCAWRNPANNQRFGVLIHAPLQIFGIGTGPYYKILADSTMPKNPDADAQWLDTGRDRSEPYTWTGLSGLTITATPNAQHSSMNIEVLIQDKKN